MDRIEMDNNEENNEIKMELNKSDEENVDAAAKSRRTKTKKEQLDLIVAFYQSYNEELVNTETFNRLWENLTVQLNCIGPPSHSNSGWRRVWTTYKYNKKRKRVSAIEDNNLAFAYNQPPQFGSIGDPLHRSDSNNTIVPDNIYDQPTQFGSVCDNRFHSEILKRLGDVIERQDMMIQQLVESNMLLKEMAKKF